MGFHWVQHPGFDFAIIPDIIDGTEADNDALIAQWPSDLHAVGVPVWHYHESLSRLSKLVANWNMVALGSSKEYLSIGTDVWWARTAKALAVICDKQGAPCCRLHGLRMLDPEIFRRIPFRSADSANATMNVGETTRWGIYRPPSRAHRAIVLGDRIEAYNSAPLWIPPDTLKIKGFFDALDR